MSVSVDDMRDKIQEILEEYKDVVNVTTVETIKKVSEDTVQTLKATSPVGKGKGAHTYHKTWRWETNNPNSFGKYSAIVFNRGNAQLTHLLENGHDMVGHDGKLYGRVDAIPHIAPAEQKAIKEYETELKRRLNDIK